MKFALILSSILFVFQCSEKKQQNADLSVDNQWTLVELADFDSLLEGPKGAPILQVQLKDSTYFGHSGCNQYSGKFRLSGNNVHFYPAISTKMACVDNGLESAYFVVLHEADSFSLEGLKLNLLTKGRVVAVFSKDN